MSVHSSDYHLEVVVVEKYLDNISTPELEETARLLWNNRFNLAEGERVQLRRTVTKINRELRSRNN